jgi:hypothetical protein
MALPSARTGDWAQVPYARPMRGVESTTSFDHLICVPADDPRLKK